MVITSFASAPGRSVTASELLPGDVICTGEMVLRTSYVYAIYVTIDFLISNGQRSEWLTKADDKFKLAGFETTFSW